MENNTVITSTKKVSNLPGIMSIDDMPIILPNIDKKELFNSVQETFPINDLVGQKFKILGIIPEYVDVTNEGFFGRTDLTTGEMVDEEKVVKRLRTVILTDLGSFHAFSLTFNKALIKALNVFGDKLNEYTFTLAQKVKGTGDSATSYYIVKVV